MSTSAIVMMVVSMTLLWGGMIAAMINVHRRPDMQRESAEETSRE
ncbi:methionine/alanine import family NSS transporter small subunit [Streptomyces lonarensis]|uniref:Methionine/alanine import family NSS transporter small subunit n=1 Tax=Streptomyces lonarensis TaxID=700599 RepID=A0A7X6CYC5_9ACTN|nr:methionine/alanine import family NSS transporter small subunit [Streptomyces lonarensis]NJQ04812.1 methionine/alanine import family NSS transporter small subunit [Streptomyces lonarensis]